MVVAVLKKDYRFPQTLLADNPTTSTINLRKNTMINDKIKCVVVGPAGAGKTTLATSVGNSGDSVMILNMESGLLSIKDDFKGEVYDIRTWKDFRNIICWITGPNENILNSDEPLSKAHYEFCVKKFGGEFKQKYPNIDTIFVDSLTEGSRLCKAFIEKTPEVKTEKGTIDNFKVYGMIKDEIVGLMSHLRHADFNIVMAAILEQKEDSLGDKMYGIQLVGKASGRELPGLVDEVFIMDTFLTNDGQSYRALITSKPNKYDFEAKDRSGKLNKVEAPDLNNIFEKIKKGEKKSIQRSLPANI